MACALYWFNPLAWLAARQMRRERERACDDLVLRAGARPSDYAAHLLQLARGFRSARVVSFATVSMARPSQLEGRLLSILDPSRRRSGLSRRFVGLGVIASALMIVPLASVRLGVRAAEPVSTREHSKASTTQATEPHIEGKASVSGLVSDAQGKPIAGAKVAVVAAPRLPTNDPGKPTGNRVLGSTRTDPAGRFRIEYPLLSREVYPLAVVAGGIGWGLGYHDIHSEDVSQEANMTLDHEQVIQGRFIDFRAQPVPRAVVLVVGVRADYRGDGSYIAVGDAPPWPHPVTSDEHGRFKLSGLSPLEAVWLEVRSDRTARDRIKIEAGQEGRAKEKLIALAPAQTLDVHVVRGDTGKPVAGAEVNVRSVRQGRSRSPSVVVNQMTDHQGRALINPYEGDRFMVAVDPPVGEPYLPRRRDVSWPKGAAKLTVEMELKHGITVHGTISEEPSGKPVPGARVGYIQTQRDNTFYAAYRDLASPHETVTGTDGKFAIVVPPGQGHLLVQGPTNGFLHLKTSNLELGVSGLPIWPMNPDALVHLDLKPGEKTHEVAMRLNRGVTVRGRVIGPDGTPIAKAFAFGRSYVPLGGPFFGAITGSAPEIPVRDGRFEITGCDPEKPYTFFFLDLEHQLGNTVELSGKQAGQGPVTVQLQHCGAATFQWKDREGKPVARQDAGPLLMLIITPGTDAPARDKVMASSVYQANLDWERLGRKLRTDADGRATFVSLIPGATYRIHGREFIAEAGKTWNLGEVVMEKPARR